MTSYACCVCAGGVQERKMDLNFGTIAVSVVASVATSSLVVLFTQHLISRREKQQWLRDKRLEAAVEMLRAPVNIMRMRATSEMSEYSVARGLSELNHAKAGIRLLFSEKVVLNAERYIASIEPLLEGEAGYASAEEKEAKEEVPGMLYRQLADSLKEALEIE
jgi:hypothetical protein